MPLAEIGECTKQVIAEENRNPHFIYKNSINKKKSLLKQTTISTKQTTSTLHPIPQNYIFEKTKNLLHIKEYKELLKPTLDHILPYYQDR